MKNAIRISRSITLLALLCLVGNSNAEEHTGMFAGIDLGLAYTHNDNVPRAAYGFQRSDSIMTGTVGKSYRKSTGERTQLVYSWLGSIDQYVKYEKLSHARLGINGAWQYRKSGAFGTPTYSLLGRIYGDSYRSGLRSGNTIQLGGSVSKSVTDRITVTAIAEAQQRDAASTVFDTKNTSARLNLDYLLSQRSILYLTYNHLTGSITYSADWVLPYSGYTYEDMQADDAFYTNWRAYRMSGTTQVVTLGYNYMFNEKSSLDLSLVSAKSSVYAGPSYSSTIMSVAYLKRL